MGKTVNDVEIISD
jgi:centrosomal protein CEP41